MISLTLLYMNTKQAKIGATMRSMTVPNVYKLVLTCTVYTEYQNIITDKVGKI